MRFLLKWILSSLVIYLISKHVYFVKILDLSSLVVFMLLVAFLNVSLKPLLILLTIPATIVTFGLFLLVINGIIVVVADYFIKGIYIENGLWGAILFSVLITLSHYVIDLIIGE